MKVFFSVLFLPCLFCATGPNCFSLDREAFTFTNYNLDVRIDPDQQRLEARGRITLRNDSQTTQRIAVLQISSSLHWSSIRSGGEPLQIVLQSYTSDIDHTGDLSEALVTLPRPIGPKTTIDLDIGYEGVIVLDATRLIRVGAPESTARSIDWDQINTSFTAVRGVGYVAWYPIATQAASLSEENSLSGVVDRWKARHADSTMSVVLKSTADRTILFSGSPNGFAYQSDEKIGTLGAFTMEWFGTNVPTFVLANYGKIDVEGVSSVFYLPNHEEAAKSYAQAMANLDPIPTSNGSRRLQVLDVPDPEISEFVSEKLLLLPLKPSVTEEDRLALVYAVARGELMLVHRPWISEGLAHCEQAIDIENRRGREAALGYLEAHRAVLVAAERNLTSGSRSDEADRRNSLIQSTDEVYVASKAMWVWWMLRDLLHQKDLALFMLAYRPDQDKEPSYVQRLIEKQQRDLEWFFDDWVYRDRGLPDFKIDSAFTRKLLPEGYMVTITVENLGAAGAEVPLFVRAAGEEVTKRLLIRSKSNAVVRVETVNPPEEIVVNDGSVPESDTANNSFKIDPGEITK
jgi:hypothetical protein